MAQRRKALAVKTIDVAPYKRTYTLTEKVCPVCGQIFTGTPKARYDTTACRQKANYHRHSTDYLETRRAKYQAEKKTTRKK